MDPFKRQRQAGLWFCDGDHKPRSVNKGSVRESGKRLIRQELLDLDNMDVEREEQFQQEVELALYCHHYGPCPNCSGNSDTEE